MKDRKVEIVQRGLKVRLLTEVVQVLDELNIEYRLGTGAFWCHTDGDFIPGLGYRIDVPAEQLNQWQSLMADLRVHGFDIYYGKNIFKW